MKIIQFIKDRFDICDSCEKFNRSTYTCKECGCFMPVKITIPLTSCPLGKWEEKKEEENKE